MPPKMPTQKEVLSLTEAIGEYDDHTMRLLAHGLRAAAGVNEQYGDIYAPDLSFKDYRNAHGTLHKELLKLAEGRGNAERSMRVVKQAAKKLPAADVEAFDSYDRTLATTPLHKRHLRDSHFEQLLDSLPDLDDQTRRDTAAMLAEIVGKLLLNKPGKGGGNRAAVQYVAGLIELMHWFAEALPANTITANPKSVFYRYAAHWLTYYTASEVESPERHIRAAIDAKSRWIKISL